MANRNDNHLQGNMYDKLFKENIQQNLSGIVKHVLSLDVTTIEVLNEDVQYTKERKTDLLTKVIDKNGNTYLLHVEYQTNNYRNMHYRMAEYSIMLQRKYKLPVKQFVIYIGPGKANMPTVIDTKDHKFRYTMTSLSAVDYRLFLKSDAIEEKMLAVLGNIDPQDSVFVLEEIVKAIKYNVASGLSTDRYLQQLHVLVKLRNLGDKLEEVMINVADFFKEEEDPLFRRGHKKGKIEEQIEIARNFKSIGVATTDIAKGTGLSVMEVEAL
ncbi:hypothetical protein FBD94_06355 [Pedobacter hiemivivus]|uniref:Rpn family recombination-promoting nuclease/putative transposase n=1 Tax=Pedobacter hiemivivus TaxID=2530454 RepID=A0A4U1GIA3_9SPHI|nr:hypothetical protein [Pedobacter hiemivivus]TKC63961.1 hypothetical protein FBD94_06355 [Pedobacter hiemivivus]